MGLGAYPASGLAVARHARHARVSYEANHAMHDCDVMVCIGARFDDRVTGKLDAFSPGSKKIHIDIDPSSIGKIVKCDVAIVGDAGEVLDQMLDAWAGRPAADLSPWWAQIDAWRARHGFAYAPSETVIKPQHAVERLYALTRGFGGSRGARSTSPLRWASTRCGPPSSSTSTSPTAG